MLPLFVVLLPFALLAAARSHPRRRDVGKSMQRSNLTDAFRYTDTQLSSSSIPGNTPPQQVAKRSRGRRLFSSPSSWLSSARGRPSSMASVPIKSIDIGGLTTMISIRNSFDRRSTTFNVLIDISETDLWVFSSKCTDPRFADRKKYVPKNMPGRKPKTFKMEYVDNSCIEGTVHSGEMALGSVKLGKQYFGAAATVTTDHPYDGSIGLSFDTTSEFEGHTSFLQNVIQRRKISPVFSIYHAGRDSELHLGIDQNAYTGTIEYHDVLEGAPVWMLGNAHITVQKHTYRVFPTTICTVSKFIHGPAETVRGIYGALGGEQMTVENISNVWTFPCDKEPKVSIKWGVNDWEIQGFNVGRIPEAQGKCFGAIQEAALAGWTINPKYLRGAYIVFDLEHKKVGFAKLRQ